MYGRWIVLGIVGLMTVIDIIGFSSQVYNWIVVMFIGILTEIEIKRFVADKHMFRLSIVIPLIIGIIFATPIVSMLPKTWLIVLRLLGVAVIVLYFFCDYKVRNKQESSFGACR